MIANLLIENQETLDLADEVLESFLDYLEECEMMEEDYVDLSFMDEEDEMTDEEREDGWAENSEVESD